MKKLLNKLRKKSVDQPAPSRITTDTVAQHREQILAGGRRFKYPLQYARHKLVINAILISVAALILIIAIGWWQLYPSQNTSEFFYRITKVLPLPVAYVDGQPVLYSDYLMKYRSSVNYLTQKEQVNLKTEDGKKQIDYVKQQSMYDSIADAYAVKLAKNLGITVSDTELEIFLQSQRQSSDGEISKQTYDAVILDYYNWSPTEYRHVTQNKILRQKVSYDMDKDAQKTVDSVTTALKATPASDFKTLADSIAKQSGLKVAHGLSGWVPKINQDGGLSTAASKLKKSEISSVIKSLIGDGYYIVKLLDINDNQVNYEYIQVPLTAFNNSLNSVIDKGKVQKFISVK
jgi:hypothetical protein